MTITELMAGKAPGTIKVRRTCHWKDGQFFVPYFIHRIGDSDCWYGDVTNTASSGSVYPYFVNTDDWELHGEAKPKTIVYEWMAYNPEILRWFLISGLMTEEEMEQWAGIVRKTGRQFEV